MSFPSVCLSTDLYITFLRALSKNLTKSFLFVLRSWKSVLAACRKLRMWNWTKYVRMRMKVRKTVKRKRVPETGKLGSGHVNGSSEGFCSEAKFQEIICQFNPALNTRNMSSQKQFSPRTGECMRCYCRPMWCLECMGKWYASRQDQSAPETWMSSRSPCPTCRATFCMLDVCMLS